MNFKMVGTAGTVLLAFFLSSLALAQSTTSTEPDLNARFSKALGTDSSKVVQHYYLVKNGGVIEFTAKDPNDTRTVSAVQKYLESQKDLFEKGKNETYTELNGKVPDGMALLKKLRSEITFYTVKNDNGAVLRMFSVNDQARQAIQDFLKFQINDYKTGDPLTVEE